MNRALRQARGDVIAVTDDCSELPVEWVEQGVDSLTNWTAATTGPVVAAPGSAGPFLTLPGSRPNPGPEPWFSPFNSFYARAVALEVGGFDESRESPGWGGKTGWDTSLASRILRDGLPVRAVREPTVNRLFPFPRSEPYRWRKRWMAIEFIRACQLPAAIRALGVTGDRMLVGHVFASSRTALFDALVVGVVAAAISRNAWWLLLTIPWLYALRRYLPVWPPSEWSTAARNFQGILIRHALWLGGLAAGSIAARRPVL
jgi:hypothetical protein